MFTIEAEKHFDSAHFLKGYEGACANLHGHRWLVRATACGQELISEGPKRAMVMDFGDLKSALGNMVDALDHKLIYEVGTLSEGFLKALSEEGFDSVEIPVRPTAEALAAWFYERLKLDFPELSAITVFETPTNSATYRRP